LADCFKGEDVAMNWQQGIAWSAIALAAVYVLWRGVLALRGTKTGCSGGCGCAKTTNQAKAQPNIIAPEELVFRQRPNTTK
jgi:hypothetical protein